MKGIVIKNKNDKSLIVSVSRLSSTYIKGKVIKKRSKYVVHDPDNKGNIGDTIEFEQCKPISHTKRWRLTKTILSGISEFTESTQHLNLEVENDSASE